MLLGLIFLASCLPAASSAGISFKSVRYRGLDDVYGKKLKIAYDWMPDGNTVYEVCLSCEFEGGDSDRQRVGDAGSILEGHTCGGPPNGCSVAKGDKLPEWGGTFSLSGRYWVDGEGDWSPWGTVYTYQAPSKGSGGGKMSHLKHTVHDDL